MQKNLCSIRYYHQYLKAVILQSMSHDCNEQCTISLGSEYHPAHVVETLRIEEEPHPDQPADTDVESARSNIKIAKRIRLG